MRSYYHKGSTCPSCHEPHATGYPLKCINDHLICCKCGAKFKKKIDLFSAEDFSPLTDYILKDNEEYKQSLSSLPLTWEIIPNKIEKEYIEWFCEDNEGIFLITWPWRNVKFVPLLVSEYLLEHTGKKVTVIGNFEKENTSENIISKLLTPAAFDNLIFIENPISIENKAYKAIKKATNKLDRTHILEKRRVVEIRYRKYGTNEKKDKLCHYSLTRCKNQVLDPESEFGVYNIRNLTVIRSNGTRREELRDKNGLWDVTLQEQNTWTGKLKYKKAWLGEVVINSAKLKSCHLQIKNNYCTTEDELNSIPENAELCMISSGIDVNKIFDTIKNISPDILIIENTDEIISDSRYMGEKSKAFLDYLNTNPSKTVILFSTNPDMRQYYKLNETKSVFGSINVIPHTWDSIRVLDKIEPDKESRFPNPISSSLKDLISEIKNKNNNPVYEYQVVDSLNNLVENIEPLIENLDKTDKGDFGFFLKELCSSPLNIKGDSNKPEVFSANRIRQTSITYPMVMNTLYEELDQTYFFSIEKTFKDVFKLNSTEQMNPVREKIYQLIDQNLDDKPKWHITIVVHPFEVKGTKNLLEQEDRVSEQKMNKISCSSWRNLNKIEKDIPEGSKHCVISARYPSIDYNMYSSTVDKFIFIGIENKITLIKEILGKRLLEINAYPVIKPTSKSSVPPLLEETLDTISIPRSEYITKINREYIMPDAEKMQSGGESVSYGGEYTYSKIEDGSEAILCTDPSDRGLFIQFNHSVMIKQNNLFDDITIDESQSIKQIYKNLVDQEIILNRSGLSTSFRSIFFKFMIKYGDEIHFERGPFEWHGFKDLFNDSVQWIELLENAVKKYAEKYSLCIDEAEYKIGKILSDSEITASDIDYIIKWWNNYDYIGLDNGNYRLYRIERPFSPKDMFVVYQEIQKMFPDMIDDPEIASKIYAAVITLQKVRKMFMNKSGESPELKYGDIAIGFRNEIAQIISDAELFHVTNTAIVKLSEDVEAMKIKNNYQDFISN